MRILALNTARDWYGVYRAARGTGNPLLFSGTLAECLAYRESCR